MAPVAVTPRFTVEPTQTGLGLAVAVTAVGVVLIARLKVAVSLPQVLVAIKV